MTDPVANPTPDKLDPRTVRIGTLTPLDVAEVLDALERLREEFPGRNRRKSSRLICTDLERVALVLNPERGQRSVHAVVPVDLSAGGACVLHGALLYPDTPVALVLQSLAGEFVAIPGVVRRCRYLAKKIHEIALRFNEGIDIARFIAVDTHAENEPLADAPPEATSETPTPKNSAEGTTTSTPPPELPRPVNADQPPPSQPPSQPAQAA